MIISGMFVIMRMTYVDIPEGKCSEDAIIASRFFSTKH